MIRPGQDPWTVEIGAIGVAWAVAVGSFFLSLASRRVDDRLMLAGYSPSELVLGRLLFLEAFGLLVAAGYSVLIIADMRLRAQARAAPPATSPLS